MRDKRYYEGNLDEKVSEKPDFDETIFDIGRPPSHRIRDYDCGHQQGNQDYTGKQEYYRASWQIAWEFIEGIEDDHGEQKGLSNAIVHIGIEELLLIIGEQVVSDQYFRELVSWTYSDA